MLEGMSFTIEPILCQGTSLGMKWDDNWTIVTKDGGRSAQFEHTVYSIRIAWTTGLEFAMLKPRSVIYAGGHPRTLKPRIIIPIRK